MINGRNLRLAVPRAVLASYKTPDDATPLVLSIQPPGNVQTSALPDIVGLDRSAVAAAPLEPARVKWFDKSKGFGFANVFGKPQDVFLHIEVLRQSGLSDLQPGEALAMRVIEGKRGRMAAEVQAWETVLTEREDE